MSVPGPILTVAHQNLLPASFNDIDLATNLLPAHQSPYGPDCKIDCHIQSILFHHNVSQASIAILIKNSIFDLKAIMEVNPDGTAEQKKLFNFCTTNMKKLQRMYVKKAFCQILQCVPMAAVLPDPVTVLPPDPATLLPEGMHQLTMVEKMDDRPLLNKPKGITLEQEVHSQKLIHSQAHPAHLVTHISSSQTHPQEAPIEESIHKWARMMEKPIGMMVISETVAEGGRIEGVEGSTRDVDILSEGELG